jgi:hypothetical protein
MTIQKTLELSDAKYGVFPGKQAECIDIRSYLQTSGYTISKNQYLKHIFGDPHPSQQKCVYALYTIKEQGTIEFMENAYEIHTGGKRLGFTKDILYEFELYHYFMYKVVRAEFSLQNVEIVGRTEDDVYSVPKDKWDSMFRNLCNNDTFRDLPSTLHLMKWLDHDPFEGVQKKLRISWNRCVVYEQHVYEIGGMLVKDLNLLSEIPMHRLVLCYHFLPRFSHPLMNIHLYYLEKCTALFDKLVISVALDTEDEEEDEVRSELSRYISLEKVTFLFTRNCARRGEAVSFHTLLNHVANDKNDYDYLMYAHSKGFTHHNIVKVRNVACWTELMYLGCLGNIDKMIACPDIKIGGNFLRHGMFQHFSFPRWHYSGSFYWMKTTELSRRNLVYRYMQDYYITEKFPGLVCPHVQKALTFISFQRNDNASLYDTRCVEQYRSLLLSCASDVLTRSALS